MIPKQHTGDDKTLYFRRRKNNLCQYNHYLFLLVLALETTLI